MYVCLTEEVLRILLDSDLGVRLLSISRNGRYQLSYVQSSESRATSDRDSEGRVGTTETFLNIVQPGNVSKSQVLQRQQRLALFNSICSVCDGLGWVIYIFSELKIGDCSPFHWMSVLVPWATGGAGVGNLR